MVDKALAHRPASVSGLGRLWRMRSFAFIVVYLAFTLFVARSGLNVQSLVHVAAIFGILAISLDLVAGMLGLYSLGQGGFFAIGAYLTTLVSAKFDTDVFLLLPAVLVITGVAGAVVGATSLRVGGLYFAITTFVFTLVLTVMAIDFPDVTGGTQGVLGPMFPDFPDAAEPLGSLGQLDDHAGAAARHRAGVEHPPFAALSGAPVDPRRRALRRSRRRAHRRVSRSGCSRSPPQWPAAPAGCFPSSAWCRPASSTGRSRSTSWSWCWSAASTRPSAR